MKENSTFFVPAVGGNGWTVEIKDLQLRARIGQKQRVFGQLKIC